MDTSCELAVGGEFRCTIPVRWGDMDALRHVNNTVYFRYFEEARVQKFEQAGIGPACGRATIVAHTSCDFIQPIIYPATVVLTQTVKRIGRSSLEIESLMECQAKPDILYAKGRYVMVLADSITGKPVPWTSAELARLHAVLSH